MPAVVERPSSAEASALPTFPIEGYKGQIESGMRADDVYFLIGHTGSGKSTYGPEYLLHAIQKEKPSAQVLVTQPRRLAAEKISQFVASRMGEDVVGYTHGGGGNVSEKTKITFTVDASLTNRLHDDPLLSKYDAVFIDEAHEQNIDMALNFGLLKRANMLRKEKGMKPIKIVVASATIDKEKLGRYFGKAGEIEVEGKMFPVEQHFSDEKIDIANIPSASAKKAVEVVKDTKNPGDVLVFLPGKAEIDEAMQIFSAQSPDIEAVALMGGDDESGAYDKINHKDDNPVVFFATNVAEASITIPKVTKVIDSGLTRGMFYDPETGLTSLLTVDHAHSNYKQRIGRAGRVRPGDSYALFTEEEYKARSEHVDPEIMRTDVVSLILRLKSMDIADVHAFDFMDHPGVEKIDQALQTLFMLGAIDTDGVITQEGKEMVELPLDPHYARMMVEAKKLGCVDAVSILIGIVSSKKHVFTLARGEQASSKYRDFVMDDSDFLSMLSVWNEFVTLDREKGKEWATKKGIDRRPLIDALRMRRELGREKSLRDAGLSKENAAVDLATQKNAIIASVIAGFADKVVVKDGGTYKLADGKKTGMVLGNRSVAAGEYMVSADIRSNERLKKTFVGMNQVIPEDVYKAIMERMKQAPSPLQLDTTVEHTPTDLTHEGHVSKEDVTETSNTLQEEKKHTNIHDEHHQLEQVKADIHAIERYNAHASSNHDSHRTSHGDSEKKTAWQEFKTAMREIGYMLTTPFRKLWRIFSGGKKQSRGH